MEELVKDLQQYSNSAAKYHTRNTDLRIITKNVRNSLVATGKESIQPVIDALMDHHNKRIAREQIAFALGEIGSKQAIEPLVTELQKDWYHCHPCGEIARALDKLGWIPDNEAVRTSYLIAKGGYLADIGNSNLSWPSNYDICIKELREMTSNEAIEVMIQTIDQYFDLTKDYDAFFGEGNPYLIDKLMEILASYKEERIIRLLMDQLDRNIEDLNGGILFGHGYAASKALVMIGMAAVPQLVKIRDDESTNSEVRAMVEMTLRQINAKTA